MRLHCNMYIQCITDSASDVPQPAYRTSAKAENVAEAPVVPGVPSGFCPDAPRFHSRGNIVNHNKPSAVWPGTACRTTVHLCSPVWCCATTCRLPAGPHTFPLLYRGRLRPHTLCSGVPSRYKAGLGPLTRPAILRHGRRLYPPHPSGRQSLFLPKSMHFSNSVPLSKLFLSYRNLCEACRA